MHIQYNVNVIVCVTDGGESALVAGQSEPGRLLHRGPQSGLCAAGIPEHRTQEGRQRHTGHAGELRRISQGKYVDSQNGNNASALPEIVMYIHRVSLD